MSNFNKYFLIFFASSFLLLFTLGFIFLFIVTYSLDGVEYSKKNIFDYYFLTPSIIQNAPFISNDAIYYSVGDDNYGFTRDKVTWEGVSNISIAREKLEAYLKEQGVQKYSDDNTADKYLIVSYDHMISLEIIIPSR
ncbi:hypothetical protein M2371_002491 [Buttiauxella sp. BIGb0471]|uniref:hypothetical protein n=1 Tax=Buttiauxella sp. BIGb0471 TaxID=2940597 RepID=UPI0021695798|nr:hypothetical protein [Buttiauxella sp. BIGb0471]MCS3603268.1 hypothetical protein [Buttiauxella sp. BIGb0471]